MKKWNAAEIVELNIAETAHGWVDSIMEFSVGKHGFNNDLVDGNDTPGSIPNVPNNNNNETEGGNDTNSTPDTLS